MIRCARSSSITTFGRQVTHQLAANIFLVDLAVLRFSVRLLPGKLNRFVVRLHDLRIREPHRRQQVDPRFDRAIRDRLRMELLLDPSIDSDFQHRIDIARPRPEREPVERMKRALSLGKFRIRSARSGQQRDSDDSDSDLRHKFHERWTREEGVRLPRNMTTHFDLANQ
jgi:hypothetical protein